MTNEERKNLTIELYNSLPQEEEARKARIDVRDKIIELNYTFFGYIASHTYVENRYISYEDKFQSALCHFCQCWWWYKFAERYRTDLAFSTFFKPRISEMMEREFNEVKYATRRSLCMEVGEMVGKHWGKVRYEDLSDPRVDLPVEKMNSLKAIFGNQYVIDLADYESFLITHPLSETSIDDLDDNYNSIEELLIREMIDNESKLTSRHVNRICNMYGLDRDLVESKIPEAERLLYKRLHENIDLQEILET